MKPFVRIVLTAIISMFVPVLAAQAQTPDQEKELEKALYESVDKEVERLERLLGLNSVQVFYVDSTLTHDYKAMTEELTDLQKKKTSSTKLYYAIQYKWEEATYQSYSKIFNADQWNKYLKSGAAKLKKTRDKFFGKSEKKK